MPQRGSQRLVTENLVGTANELTTRASAISHDVKAALLTAVLWASSLTLCLFLQISQGVVRTRATAHDQLYCSRYEQSNPSCSSDHNPLYSFLATCSCHQLLHYSKIRLKAVKTGQVNPLGNSKKQTLIPGYMIFTRSFRIYIFIRISFCVLTKHLLHVVPSLPGIRCSIVQQQTEECKGKNCGRLHKINACKQIWVLRSDFNGRLDVTEP